MHSCQSKWPIKVWGWCHGQKNQQTELFVYSYLMMRQSHDFKAAALITECFLQHYDGPFHLCRRLPFDGSSKWLSVKRLELTRLCFICVKVRRELTSSVKEKIKMSNYFQAPPPQKFKVEIFISNASISTWTYCCGVLRKGRGRKGPINLIKNSSRILILSGISFNFLKTISGEQAGPVMTIICNYVS